MTYFNVNQCLRYKSFNTIEFTFSQHSQVKLALAIPACTPTTLADEMIETPLLVALKTTKILSM